MIWTRRISPLPSAPRSTRSRFAPEQGGEPTSATPDSGRPTDGPDPPLSAGRIKAVPLTAEDSARLRDRLLAEIAGLTCEEEVGRVVHTVLAASERARERRWCPHSSGLCGTP
jgi:hypothetical protein